MKSLSKIKLNIAKKLEDKEYFHKFFKIRSQDEIAEAIRDLRDDRGLNQTELAELSGMKQSAICRTEKPSYGKWNFQTLWRVAKALDARWKIILEPMENVIKEYKNKEDWLNANAPGKMQVSLSENSANENYKIPQKKVTESRNTVLLMLTPTDRLAPTMKLSQTKVSRFLGGYLGVQGHFSKGLPVLCKPRLNASPVTTALFPFEKTVKL